ncbi:glycosyltransferase [Alloscardovia omnicolens]|uniref:glycosyltransferase n=1 Tax=Alloscardovia omnicolens TaxID=419015 RepID=UPI003A637262
MRKLRIALVVDSLGEAGNGTSNSAVQFAEELERQGHTVRLVGIGAPDERYQAQERYVLGATEFARPHQLAFAQPDDALFEKAFEGVDVVHIYLPFAFGKAAARYCRAHQIPVTAGFHVLAENIVSNASFLKIIPGIVPAIYGWMHRRFYKKIRHIHTPTYMTKRILKARHYTNIFHVFSNGYDDDLFRARQCEPAYVPSKSRFIICAAGRFSREKGHETLIRAVAMSKHKDEIELRLAGAGPLEKDLDACAREMLDEGQYSFSFVQHEDMPAFYADSNLFVHASSIDIEGISAIEAMAVGVVPVIARADLSAASGFALCRHSVFECGDAQELAEQIDWWIEHPEERAEWGNKYARHTHDYYSLCASVQAFVRMEQQAIDDVRE